MPDCGPGVTPVIGPDPLTGVCEASCPERPPPAPPVPPVPPPCECPAPPVCPMPSPPPPEPPPAPPVPPAGPVSPPPEEESCHLPHRVSICAGPAPPDSLRSVVWCSPNVCENVDAILAGITNLDTSGAGMPGDFSAGESSIADYLWRGVTFPLTAGYVAGKTVLNWFKDDPATSDEISREAGRELSLQSVGTRLTSLLLSGPFAGSLEHKDAVIRLGSQIASADRAERLTGFPMSYLAQSSQYALQYSNPQYIPGQSELDLAFLHGKIDENVWTCQTKANGNFADCARVIRAAKETKPNTSEVMSLYLRGYLTEKELLQRMRELGVLDPSNTVDFRRLAEFIPPYTDITSFMVRDTFDEKVVEQYQYDKGFTDKFQGKAFEWAKAQGIDPEVFKMIWRAHWKIPSNTQMYDMVNRLRPGRKDVRDWEKRWIDPTTGEPFPDAPDKPPVFTLGDLRKALEVNDVAPTFIESLIQINTRPINRTDLIDAYHSNAIDEDELFEGLRDNNYSATNAQKVVDIQKVKRGRRLANLTGVWTFRKIVQAFQQGIIDTDKADKLLTDLMPDAVQRQDILVKANDEVNARIKTTKIKKARRAFFVGEWTQDETRKFLGDTGLDPLRIHQLIETWDSERTGRFREATVEMLRKWLVINVITQDEMYGRLIRLGFSDIDSRRIIAQSIDDSVQRQRKEFGYVRKEYQAAFSNLKQAAKADNPMLLARQAELQAAANKIQAELARIEKTLADRAP